MYFRREESVERWRQIIEEQRRSGMTMRDYCRKHGLNQSCFSRAKSSVKEWYRRNPVIDFSWPLTTDRKPVRFSVLIEYNGISIQPGLVTMSELRDYLLVIREEMR